MAILGERISRVALIGNHPPRMCGIATFTADVRSALVDSYPSVQVDVYAMEDGEHRRDYPSEVVCAIPQNDLAAYQQAAQQINDSGAEIVCVQHEYGIFGGPAGAYLLKLLDRVRAPVVTVLHTVLEEPNADQRAVIEALARRSSKLIVMVERGREMLTRIHGIDPDRIAVVPHGVPDRPFGDGVAEKEAYGLAGKRVLLTFGLLSPNKGIETMIRALPPIVAAHPETVYVVLGATHPHLVQREGEAYRDSLKALAAELGVSEHVRFVDGFVAHSLLMDYLAAADVYITPYLHEAQITSGTLSYAVALGKPVVSTPYWHAADLLGPDGVGIIVPFGDVAGFSREVGALLDDPNRLQAIRSRAYEAGRAMTWDKLAKSYMGLFRGATHSRTARLVPALAKRPTIHAPKLDAVERLTDGCGMIQHSIFSVPDRNHGYCVDDNCRALMLMHRVGGAEAKRADQLATIYASFVQFAWNGDRGRFRNFMAFDRRWLEEEGSADSFGRSLWSIGVTAAEAKRQDLKRWAMHLFDQVAPHCRALDAPRTWAFALLGADAVLNAHPSHTLALSLVREFGRKLHQLLGEQRRENWVWFEDVLAYDNARLPEALILAGRRLGDEQMVADGLAALTWLDEMQTSPDGQFRAVGTDSFGRVHQPPLPFDQQPLEAWATIDACTLAYEVTGEDRWYDAAMRAYGWYLGQNDVGVPIASVADGGCFDGLMPDRANLNQGAESVLSYQFACCAMQRLAENRAAADDQRKRASAELAGALTG